MVVAGKNGGFMLKNTALTVLCALLFLPAAHAADLHACKLSPDRRSVTVLVSNPYTPETHCTVNCHVTFPGEGINIVSITCARTVPGGAKDFALCSRTRDNNGVFVKLADAGNSEGSSRWPKIPTRMTTMTRTSLASKFASKARKCSGCSRGNSVHGLTACCRWSRPLRELASSDPKQEGPVEAGPTIFVLDGCWGFNSV